MTLIRSQVNATNWSAGFNRDTVSQRTRRKDGSINGRMSWIRDKKQGYSLLPKKWQAFSRGPGFGRISFIFLEASLTSIAGRSQNWASHAGAQNRVFVLAAVAPSQVDAKHARPPSFHGC